MPYRLRPDKAFSAAIRSVAKSQLSAAIRLLEEQPEGPHRAVHEARKRFKRVRALYRLVQYDAKAFRTRENARIRDIARSLSTVRDVTALVETVDYLASHAASPEEFAALTTASRALTERRESVASAQEDLPDRMAAAAAGCRDAIAALGDLDLDDTPRKTARRLERVWKKQRQKALATLAACEAHVDAEAFHELRKCGQIYRLHLALLRDAWPSAMRAKQVEAKTLVELLGHEHDLSVLTGLVNERPELFGDSEALALVIGAIIIRQQALRTEALDKAREVFADDAESEGAIIALLWQRAASAPRQPRKPVGTREDVATTAAESALHEPG